VWWRDGAGRLSRSAEGEIDRANAIGISAMSLWELRRLEHAGRMSFDRRFQAWLASALSDDRIEVIPVSKEIALTAGSISGDVRDPADQIIYATAVECGSRLVSQDSRLKSHDPARIIW
jgi:PIN domain nuclease of toxin-antitoxin system